MEQKECVVNFPSQEMQENVERIAALTGADPVPEYKRGRYIYSADKFGAGGFARMDSELVDPPRILGCPLQFEARLKEVVEIKDDPQEAGPVAAVVVRVQRVHAHETLVVREKHIDPTRWKPLIYNFRHYYGLGLELGKTFKAEV
jgi:flavin reductase (DIM6/NTAB) family NADH-FMN oxidoreductase RutF